MSNPLSNFRSLLAQKPASYGIENIDPPVFSGITSLVAQGNGSLLAGWSAATDLNMPIRYEIYVKEGSSTGLFSVNPQITYETSFLIFVDDSGALLEKDLTYYVGIRAIDNFGNMETNTANLSAASLGVAPDAIYNIVADVKAKTDNLPASPANEVTSAAIKAKTDNLPADPATETSIAAVKKNTDLIPAAL